MISNKSVELFKKAAKGIPGYNKFLRENNFRAVEVSTVDDFMNIPISSKKNYLQKNPHEDIMWPDALLGPLSYSSTSGSTGEPYYFPRTEELARQGSFVIEDFINNSSGGSGKTLFIVGFGMGVWIGGVITVRQIEIAAERMGAAVSVLPTGYSKIEVFKALKKLSPEFDQTIIAGYPPFIKEIVDEAESQDINLSALELSFLFAAEAFTETFRNYVCEKAGVKDPITRTLNIYGTADIGAMAYETPLSILARRVAAENPLLYKDLFGQLYKTPTLAQYNPEFVEFEVVDSEIILSSDAALPLVRYAIGDNGGVLSYNELEKLFKHHGVDLRKEIDNSGIKKSINKHPFIYVYERTDMSVTLHGILIYPEFIKEALLKNGLPNVFTERFTMSTKFDIHHNQFVKINIELQKDIEQTEKLEKKAVKYIHKELIKRSSEFAEISKTKKTKEFIKVVLWPNGHKRYFTPGTKQKWAEKP